MTGPGEKPGMAKAAKVVTPTIESSQPPARSHGWPTSRRISSTASNTASETSR